MTDTSQKLRALFLAGLMVMSVFAIAGTASAKYPERTATTGNGPITVYLGEESLDVTSLTDFPGGSTQSATFVGTSGDADGTTVTVNDVSDVDFTENNGFEPGGYNVTGNSDGQISISVNRPEINDVTLYRGNNDGGADITGGGVPEGDNVTVEADFNFGSAGFVNITLEDPNGVDITNEVVNNATISRTGGDRTLNLSTADLDTGDYTVTVEGSDGATPSDFSAASQSATFTIREEDATISLDATEVTQGETVVATVTGTPGEYTTIRIDQEDHADIDDTDTPDNATLTTAAENLFRNSDDVVNRTGNDDEDMLGAVVDLGDSGSAQVVVRTGNLDSDATVEIESVEHSPKVPDGEGEFAADADDNVDLSVNEIDVTIDEAPNTVVIGETFDISGTAPEADQVTAYAKIDETWQLLIDDDGDNATDSVDADGSYTLSDINSSVTINLPDSYRIGVVLNLDADAPPSSFSQSNFADETTATTTIRTTAGALEASLSSTEIAANVNDEVTLSGTAVGQGDEVRYFIVGPRGGTVSQRTADIEDDTFEEDDSVFSTRGTYTYIVVGQGRDGNWAGSQTTYGSSTSSATQVIELIRDDYTGAGEDDVLIELQVQASNPSITLDEVGTNGQVLQEEVTLSGTSNREDETTVFIELLDEDGNSVVSTEAEVDGESGTWETTLDFSDIDTGTYTLRADDDEASVETDVEVVTEITTETPEETPTARPPQETPTPQQVTRTVVNERTVVQERTVVVTPEPTESPGGQPGFGAIVALVALLAAALLAVRRKQ